MTVPEEVEALALAWKRWGQEPGFPYGRDHCINGSRVALGALDLLGIPARPASVTFAIFNQFAWDMYCRQIPVDKWPEHAHSIGVDKRDTHDPKPGGWYGHLIVEGDGWLLDVSAAQFDRPGRIVSDGPLLLDINLDPADDVVTVVTQDRSRQVLLLGRWPENDGWTRAPGWLRPQPNEIRELTRRTYAVLQGMRE